MEELLTIGFYNGWYLFFKSLSNYLEKNASNDYSINYPMPRDIVFEDDELGKMVDFYEFDCDMFPRVFWSFLVLKYGDYGTSPRTGWIESKNAAEIIKKIRAELDERKAF